MLIEQSAPTDGSVVINTHSILKRFWIQIPLHYSVLWTGYPNCFKPKVFSFEQWGLLVSPLGGHGEDGKRWDINKGPTRQQPKCPFTTPRMRNTGRKGSQWNTIQQWKRLPQSAMNRLPNKAMGDETERYLMYDTISMKFKDTQINITYCSGIDNNNNNIGMNDRHLFQENG